VNLYETDFHRWTLDTARKIRSGCLSSIDSTDWANIAEEIESLGKQQRQTLVSNLEILLLHLLKWQYQPSHRIRGWELSIEEHRDRIEELIHDNPSLNPFLEEAVTRGYKRARLKAAAETGMDLKIFPELCPYRTSEMRQDHWLPED
jgi:hypothetical protein